MCVKVSSLAHPSETTGSVRRKDNQQHSDRSDYLQSTTSGQAALNVWKPWHQKSVVVHHLVDVKDRADDGNGDNSSSSSSNGKSGSDHDQLKGFLWHQSDHHAEVEKDENGKRDENRENEKDASSWPCRTSSF